MFENITSDTPFGIPLEAAVRHEKECLGEDTDQFSEYDKHERMIHCWDSAGSEKWLYYFADGKLQGEVWRYRNDPVGRVMYDHKGNIVHRINHPYDETLRRRIKREDFFNFDNAVGTLVSQMKYVDGLLVFHMNVHDGAQWMEYDEHGRLKKRWNDNGDCIVYECKGNLETATGFKNGKETGKKCCTRFDDHNRPLHRLFTDGREKRYYNYEDKSTRRNCRRQLECMVQPLLDGFVIEE